MPKITGQKAATDRLKRIAGREKVVLVGQALFAGGEELQAEARVSISTGSSSGQSGGKHQHIPSRPGEPPNYEWGDLSKGIIVEKPAPLRVLVTSNAPHGVPLEYGTSKMAARPYMGPAARKTRKSIVDRVNKVINIVTAKKG